ncbi:Lcl C-terminal domain-containing protein [Lentisalinibacter orientalis]|uniref:Lcl C-terminal domain-containing protein n=1 Tax=Lentisalinibacter orientalis TaxID=2992241 RepID=UPI00386ABE0F
MASALLGLLAVLSLTAGQGHAAVVASSFAACDIKASTGLVRSDTGVSQQASGSDAFPLELSVPVWEDIRREPDLAQGGYCYADENGRVRGRVVTGNDLDSPVDAETVLVWKGSYVRRSGSPDPKFTVYPSRVRILADPIDIPDGDAAKIFAEMDFEVWLAVRGGPQTTGYTRYQIYRQWSRMQGQPGKDNFDFDTDTGGIAAYLGSDGRKRHPATDGVEPDIREGSALYEVPLYSESIPLARAGVDVGDEYVIEYVLTVKAGEAPGPESWAEAFVGDPLDIDTGILLEILDDPAPTPITGCDTAPDPLRYLDNRDGTVTDARTGLMWQRCPLGYTLDDGGTAADPADDTCSPDSGATVFSWQAGLAAATDSELAGHGDWRKPDLKELESLTEACSAPILIDQSAFPGTPPEPVWTSTPETTGTEDPRGAWQIDFGSGEARTESRTAEAHVLAVRNTGAGPDALRRAITAGDAAVGEGDAGVATLEIPVGLSLPAVGNITVDYEVVGAGATAGIDFTAVAGTLIILAGETAAVVPVEVNGDTEFEYDERVLLRLSNPGGNAWLRRSVGIGTIVDDEPAFLPLDAAEFAETDAAQVVDLIIALDRPAQATITVDYATADESAVAGEDYLSASGSLVFQPGESEAVLPLTLLGDLATEGTERFQVELDNASGAALIGAPVTIEVRILDNDGAGTYAAINDSGTTECATATQALVPCPQTGYPGQDAEFGRDVMADDPSDGALGFSFLKLDSAGAPLTNQAALYFQSPWECVEDQVTGLVWEVKTDEPTDLRYYDHTYTWYDSSGQNDGGDAGTANGGICADGVNCDTEKYVAAVNAAGLCGYNDWRLASADELYTVAWLSNQSLRGMDTSYFPNHFNPPDGRGYWSSTPVATDAASALMVRMDASVSSSTTVLALPKSFTQRIRLVRGGTRLSDLP